MGHTVKLYERDPYHTTFDAIVVASLEVEGRPAVVLDRTCFYPTSGGQPHDTGTLNDVAVTDVFEEGGAIVHVLDAPLEGQHVHGGVDWGRRFDHMQQHTGQHILSQAFLRVAGAATVGFHLGEQASTIDLAVADLPSEVVQRAVIEANDVVSGDRAVNVVLHDDPSTLPAELRKAPTVGEAIRVVSVVGYDVSACCGTHVRRTGELGAIQVTRWEKAKGRTRVTFFCGGRAVADHWAKTAMLDEITALLSCGMEDVVPLVGKALDDRKVAEKQAADLQERLAQLQAQQLRAQAETVGEVSLVRHLFGEIEPDMLRQTARELVSEKSLVAVLAARAPSPTICVGCGSGSGVHAGELVRAMLAPFGGRGGGSPAAAQGGGVSPERLEEVLAAAREWLENGQAER